MSEQPKAAQKARSVDYMAYIVVYLLAMIALLAAAIVWMAYSNESQSNTNDNLYTDYRNLNWTAQAVQRENQGLQRTLDSRDVTIQALTGETYTPTFTWVPSPTPPDQIQVWITVTRPTRQSTPSTP